MKRKKCASILKCSRKTCVCRTEIGPSGCKAEAHDCTCLPFSRDAKDPDFCPEQFSQKSCRADEEFHRCSCLMGGGVGAKLCMSYLHKCICERFPGQCRASTHKCLCEKSPDQCRASMHRCICGSVGYDHCRRKLGHNCICVTNYPINCRCRFVHKCSCLRSELCKAPTHECSCRRNPRTCQRITHSCVCDNHPKFCRALNHHFCRCEDLGALECRKQFDGHECCCELGYFYLCRATEHKCICRRELRKCRRRECQQQPSVCQAFLVGNNCEHFNHYHKQRVIQLTARYLQAFVDNACTEIIIDKLYHMK